MFLFPYKTKFLGLTFIILAIPFGYLYIWGGRPDIFKVKVFAVISAYMEIRYMVLAQTNILDELAVVFLITGIVLFSFSKEKKEAYYYNELRTKALIRSVFFVIGFWILSILLIYGVAIFIVSSGIFIIYLICYNIMFRYYIFKTKRQPGKNISKKPEIQ